MKTRRKDYLVLHVTHAGLIDTLLVFKNLFRKMNTPVINRQILFLSLSAISVCNLSTLWSLFSFFFFQLLSFTDICWSCFYPILSSANFATELFDFILVWCIIHVPVFVKKRVVSGRGNVILNLHSIGMCISCVCLIQLLAVAYFLYISKLLTTVHGNIRLFECMVRYFCGSRVFLKNSCWYFSLIIRRLLLNIIYQE